MSEQYPNAPLARAIVEARFPGETAVEIARPAIQSAVRSELSQLLVPRVSKEIAPALQPYLFQASDESEVLEVAINRVNYHTRAYQGYAHFKVRALHFIDAFREHVPQVHRLNRVGLRYINQIPILRESPDSAIRLSDYVNIGLQLPQSVPGAGMTELNATFSVRLDGGTLKVVFQNAPAGPLEPERLVLDFDFSQDRDGLIIEELPSYLDIAHQHTKQVFHDLIAPRYFPVMRGENS